MSSSVAASRIVADQRVGERVRDRVHRAAGNDAEVLQAVAAAVLDRAEQPGLDDAQRHRRRRSNSARLIGTKRTRSPGANRLGGSLRASNRVSGVRATTLQPPGIAYG